MTETQVARLMAEKTGSELQLDRFGFIRRAPIVYSSTLPSLPSSPTASEASRCAPGWGPLQGVARGARDVASM